jgi:ACT domain-containing protein
MHSVSIGEIQKNISLLTQLDDVLTIVDKRKNKNVAVVYPVKKSSIVTSLAGKYKDRVQKVDDLEYAKEMAMKIALEEKYGLSS